MRHFTSVFDVSNINHLVEKALHYKANPLSETTMGYGKRIGLLFMNPSMRTRISTQIAARNLGMEAIVFNIDKEGWQLELDDEVIMNGATVEHIKDAAPVLGAYFDVLGVRTFPSLQDRKADYAEVLLGQLIQHTGIPVISLESSTLHPLQSLADIMTITEQHKEKRRPRVVLTWAPHIKPLPQCVANSFSQWVNAWQEADFVITHPAGYELDTTYTNGALIEYDQQRALQDADFVYVKNWSSFSDYGKILCEDSSWMLTPEHLDRSNQAKLMHCLPLRRNIEVSSEILNTKNNILTQQAANRVYAAQAVLSEILKHN
ncbi:MAG TPA: hypothetical protein VL098_04305 [Flavipsychrobacter sp.]|nr:hypothetical protein [Flavipsychrobacter sp.]